MQADAILWVRLSDWSASPWALVVVGLAVFRVTSLLVREDGPWEWFARWRHAVGVRYNEASEPYGTNVIAEALTCMWCASVWVGTIATVVWFASPPIAFALSLPLALSAFTVGIERMTRWP